MPSVSAQYSIILRVEIDHRPGMLGRVATAIGEAGGSIGSVDLIGIEGGHTLRDITVETAGEDHATQIGEAVDAVDGARRSTSPTARSRCTSAARSSSATSSPSAPATTSAGLHARRRPRLHRDRPGSRQGLPVHDQAQHGRGRLRRQRRARPRRHRPRGGDAGDGGQGRPVQGVRRRRRLPDLPVHAGPGQDRPDRHPHRPRFGGINLEDISAPALLRDRGAPEGRRSTSRSSTTTSTARPSSRSPR